MTGLMSDKSTPPPSDNTVQNIMTRNDMRKTRVRVTFVPKSAKSPAIRPRRWEFPTTVMAHDFIKSVNPPPGQQLGSPKQARARLARLLRLHDPSIVTKYEIVAEVEGVGPVHVGEDTTVAPDPDLDTFVENTDPVPDLLEPADVEAILNSDPVDPAITALELDTDEQD